MCKKDDKGLIILYYCFVLNYNDKICVEYFKIILEISNIDDLIIKDNNKGDIVLSIVVNCLRYSRIRSIFLFFKNGLNIIYIINEDGYLLLYFFVGCFKDIEVNFIVEFECCIRVIVLILGGVSLEKELDDDNRVVDECKYDFVKGIFGYLKDINIMEKVLEILLKKLNWI